MNDYSPDDSPPESHDAAALAFEDLTLAQAIRYLFLYPGRTARLFWDVLTRDPGVGTARAPAQEPESDWRGEDHFPPERGAEAESPAVEKMPPDAEEFSEAEIGEAGDSLSLTARIALLAAAVLLALVGGHRLRDAAINPLMRDQGDTNGAFWWFALAGILYAAAEVWQSRAWRAGMAARVGESPANDDHAAADSGSDAAVGYAQDAPLDVAQTAFWMWFEGQSIRLLLVPLAVLLSALAYGLNVWRDSVGKVRDVVFTTDGFIAWGVSVALWIVILSGDPRQVIRQFRHRRAQADQHSGSGRASWLMVLPYAFGPHPPAPSPTWREGEKLGSPPSAGVGAGLGVGGRSPARLWHGRTHGFAPTARGMIIGAALIGVTLFGLAFRLYDLGAVPPEMTSDHIEKLLDGLRVYEGYRGVFFPNNGGREGFQMVVVAFIGGTLGAGFNFTALKIATVIEGAITLPALWWMARQVIGTDTDEDRQLGHWVGIALAALVAVNSWHLMLSRLGLRVVLTPLATALAVGFLARAMRHNRMRDYLLLGAILGAGVYFYQADRMLPLLAVIGIGLAMVGMIRTPTDARRRMGQGIAFAAIALGPLLLIALIASALKTPDDPDSFGARLGSFLPILAMAWFSIVALWARAWRQDRVFQFGGGLLATAVVALALYIPMYHYTELYPDQFWNRTRGRLFGDQAFVRVDPATDTLVTYEPSIREQVGRFWDRRGVLVDNYVKSLRMHQWIGDGQWINNAHGLPAMDGIAGGLLMLGLVAWVTRAVGRRDPALWLLPAGVIVMTLPAAMSLAFPGEVPNFTRGSGTIPVIFMLAALPVGLLCREIARVSWREGRAPVGAIVAVGIVAGLTWVALPTDRDTFFTQYRLSYVYSWKPYHEIAKPLREFVEGEGSFGNAFYVHYQHWLDHRILGATAGDLRWPNGLVTREELLQAIARNRSTKYAYDPTRPLFVMYNTNDPDTAAYLDSLFPGGEHTLYEYTYEAERPGAYLTGSFYIFTVRAGEIQ